MLWSQTILLVGKYHWLNTLFESADRREPLAVGAAIVCGVILLLGLVGIVFEGSQYLAGKRALKRYLCDLLQLIVGMGIPGIVFFEIVRRMVS